jgi:hypothetical protein
LLPEAAMVFRRSSLVARGSEGKIKSVEQNHTEGGNANNLSYCDINLPNKSAGFWIGRCC